MRDAQADDDEYGSGEEEEEYEELVRLCPPCAVPRLAGLRGHRG